jgi:hypothetical protein
VFVVPDIVGNDFPRRRESKFVAMPENLDFRLRGMTVFLAM